MQKINWDDDKCPIGNTELAGHEVPGAGCVHCEKSAILNKKDVGGNTMCNTMPDTKDRDRIICPHCGHEIPPDTSWEISRHDDTDNPMRCDECQEQYNMDHETVFSTEKVDEAAG